MDHFVSQALNSTENSLILNQILKIFSSLKWDKNNKLQLFAVLLCVVPKICFIFLIKHLLKNTDDAASFVKNLLIGCFYKTENYTSRDPKSIFSFINNEIRKQVSYQEIHSLRMSINVLPNQSVIQKFRFLPSPQIYNDIIKNANEEFKNTLEGVANCMQLNFKKNFIYETIVPNQMYPCNNFMNVKNIIVTHIENSTKIGSYQTVPFLLNGEPGLGKSKLVDFLSRGSKLSCIKRVDMTKYINQKQLTIEDILDQTINIIDCHTLIMIDELDKYIAGILSREKEDISNINQSILNSILNLIEKETGRKYCLFIVFCSNNFDSIFDHVDMTHYSSLKDRFFNITFTPLEKLEYVGYLEWVYNLIRNTSLPFQEMYADSIQNYIKVLPENFKIRFRELSSIVVMNLYDFNRIMKAVYEIKECIDFKNNSSEKIVTSLAIFPKDLNLVNSPSQANFNNIKMDLNKKKIIESKKDYSIPNMIVSNPPNCVTPKVLEIPENIKENIKGEIVCKKNQNFDTINKFFPNNPFDQDHWDDLINGEWGMDGFKYGSEELAKMLSYVIYSERISEDIFLCDCSLNNHIMFNIVDMISIKGLDKIFFDFFVHLLQYPINNLYFSKCINDEDNYKVFNFIVAHPTLLETMKENDRGFFYSMKYYCGKDNVKCVEKILKFLNTDITFEEYMILFEFKKMETLEGNLKEILKYDYHKIYYLGDIKYFNNLAKKIKEKGDVYVNSLFVRFCSESKFLIVSGSLDDILSIL